VRKLLRRLAYWWRRRRNDRELELELEVHRLLHREADHASRRALGNVLLAREESREAWLGRRLDEISQDLRYGLRFFLRNPGFSLVGVLILAIGIGANAGVFAVMDALLIKRLPVERPAELFFLRQRTSNNSDDAFSYQAFGDFRSAARGHAEIFASARTEAVPIFVDGGPETVHRKWVSGNYFSALGAHAALGRLFAAEAERPAPGEPVAVLSEAYWQRRFGGDASVVGGSLVYMNRPYTIVGVAARGFFGETLGEAPELWLPLTARTDAPSYVWSGHSNTWLRVLGRARDAERARAERVLEAAFERLREQRLGQASLTERQALRESRLVIQGASGGISPLRDNLGAPVVVAMGIVACVLLIACANIATLLLERGRARERELALRIGIGASRARLVRQLLTEALILALVAGTVGLLLAQLFGSRLLAAALSGLPNTVRLSPSLGVRAVVFTASVSVLASVLCGLLPAFRATRAGLAPTLKTSAGLTRGASWLGPGLVAAQLAVSLTLLTAAGLFVRTLQTLAAAPLGFDPDGVLLFQVTTTNVPGREVSYRQLLEAAERLPGVRAASLSAFGSFGGGSWGNRITVEGYTPAPEELPRTYANAVSPRFFEVMGLPVAAGRSFTASDDKGAPGVAMVNQTFAARFFGGENPVGRHVGLGRTAERMLEIVGLVKDAKYEDVREEQRPMLYVPALQYGGAQRELQLSVTPDVPVSPTGLLKNLAQAEPSLAVVDVMSLRARVDRSLLPERMVARVAGVFSLIALTLACVGLYGVVSYAVSLRTTEIGVRIAIGATAGQVIWLVLRKGALVVGAGLLAGLAASWLVAKAIAGLLHGVPPTDPGAFAAAVVLLVGVAAAAAYVPARRAARVDPIAALRSE
jgi:predicted permease